ncbi:hypothetical protein TNCV_776831 [Trichonephila clavipes]|nr:hypothetical protein TNCV_776831 [Trichonephila clavipes]
MDMESASAATGSQVSVVSFSSLSAFNVPNALVRLNELYTSQECARKANFLLAKEHQEVIKAIVAKQPPTPSKLSSEIEVSNEFTTPVKCKRTYKSPNKGTAKKSKASEEVIALSNSYSAIAPIEIDAEDLSITEETVVDTAPGTEEEVSTPRHL